MKLNKDNYNYFVFVLGFDLLQDELIKAHLACDEAYDKCKKIIQLFDESTEIDNLNFSCYEALQNFINNNKNKIHLIINGKE